MDDGSFLFCSFMKVRNMPGFNSITIIIRMWNEPTSDQRQVLRGQMEHVQSGEVQYFEETKQILEIVHKWMSIREDDGLNIEDNC